ncbi:MAG TPA: endopeptidase La, partial [Bdellovibrionota bacterium]|nr:endopeptidase La [Bdellovibrionota bacterium]
PLVIGLVAPKVQGKEDPGPEDLYSWGVAARVVSRVAIPGGGAQLVLQGLCRIKINKYTSSESFLTAEVEEMPSEGDNTPETEGLLNELLPLYKEVVRLNPRYSDEIVRIVEMNRSEGAGVITDLIASHLNISIPEKQEILELVLVPTRMHKLMDLIKREIQATKVEQEIHRKTRGEMEKSQRDYFLRRQLDEIRKELGEGDQASSDAALFREQLQNHEFPLEVRETLDKEIKRLESMNISSADYNVLKTYLDWLVELPWMTTTQDNMDIHHAEEILEADHHGLKTVKQRILEYLAVLRLKSDQKGQILCLAGPPGVGKTSLGQSIARALGRKFIRISLGGVRDEAEIRGHRRTYVGALPGRIIQGMKKVLSKNPIFMIDEVDKISSERGDPASALLEVLDPEQNFSFRDNYIEIPFDLSQVIFICTANYLENVPAPLRDRMEVIQLPGYTLEEKMQIARKYLIKKELSAHGLEAMRVNFKDGALERIVADYTREAGVRNLDREVATICRKVAKKLAEGEQEPFLITEKNVEQFLGPPKFFADEKLEAPEIGVATGLAFTQAGGQLLRIETTRVKSGQGGFKITGSLGEVMQESVNIALTYVRSKAKELGIPLAKTDQEFIHIHFPAGAVPKDGPSAGLAITVALASLLSNRPVLNTVAMTGEISLRGHILPVGGIKEKVLAAYRGGIEKVLLPAKNKHDLDDIPKEVKSSIEFILVDHVDQAFEHALMNVEAEVKRAKVIAHLQRKRTA